MKNNKISFMYADINQGFGGKAQEIYDFLCAEYGFKTKLRNNFGMCRLLYAPNATPEGYGVWFIAHNNMVESKKTGRFTNLITRDLNIIDEIYDEKSDYYYDKTTRVVFIKVKHGKSSQYVFIGLYSPTNYEDRIIDNSKKHVKTYTRIAVTYEVS